MLPQLKNVFDWNIFIILYIFEKYFYNGILLMYKRNIYV